jgi:hypothetical protein
MSDGSFGVFVMIMTTLKPEGIGILKSGLFIFKRKKKLYPKRISGHDTTMVVKVKPRRVPI